MKGEVITETGTVTAVYGKRAKITVTKKTECEKCGLCLFKADGKSVFYAENPVNAKAGDTVTFTRTENGGIIGVLLAFGVPLLLIAVTLVINYVFVKKELFALITSVCSVIAWYAVLSAIDKKIRKAGRLGGRIISVTAKGNAEDKTE